MHEEVKKFIEYYDEILKNWYKYEMLQYEKLKKSNIPNEADNANIRFERAIVLSEVAADLSYRVYLSEHETNTKNPELEGDGS